MKKDINSGEIVYCPVCSHILDKWHEYHSDLLISEWKELGVVFSDKVHKEIDDNYNTISLYKCSNCHLEVFLPLRGGSPLFYKELQDKMSYYEDDKWDFHEALKNLENNMKIVEIGCGPGNFLEMCMKKTTNIFGTEYNSNAKQMAKNKGIMLIEKEEIDNMLGEFDRVYSFHVLEHVDEPMTFLKEMVSLLKKDGRLCISVPNQKGPIKYIKPCIMNMPPHHLTRWSLTTFIRVADELGMVLKKVSYEPLLLSNHWYYTAFWLDQVKLGSGKSSIVLKRIIKKMLSSYFNFIRRIMKFKYHYGIKGQAIYIELGRQ